MSVEPLAYPRARTIALADQISYECAVERIYFSSTVLFQSRLYRFAAAWREILRGGDFFVKTLDVHPPKFIENYRF
jgi:hypothetical protein